MTDIRSTPLDDPFDDLAALDHFGERARDEIRAELLAMSSGDLAHELDCHYDEHALARYAIAAWRAEPAPVSPSAMIEKSIERYIESRWEERACKMAADALARNPFGYRLRIGRWDAEDDAELYPHI